MPIAAEVMAEASAQTGLTDFGDDTFREGLEILLASLQDEARLHVRGQAFLRQRIVGYLSQRLQVEDWYRRHPEIDDVPIVAPLIGLGFPGPGPPRCPCCWPKTPTCVTYAGGNPRGPVPHPRRCRASITASHPTRARCSAPATTSPAIPMAPWSAMS